MFKLVVVIVGTSLANSTSKQKLNFMDTILTIAYVVIFVAFFWLFFKSVNYFENI
ncbi:hypothetical protein BDD43_2703 [Mucilaginibacter gracilis]|uniref:Uncharacterized protein n=1 Tax=Mucilaginibacter gracilis TaxID=423350 RepID=A0A495J2D4_9SPHI|nr:hypothetical protein [Mucilaginibacter gracilis]RKR82518.1 hypothetical protein BDD43_2703 [Mucilaginibacter gracilis]